MAERHYFTLYGYDDKKKETIRITSDESKGVFQNSQKQTETINICEEAKKFFKSKKDIIYFDKQIRKTKYGVATLHKSIKPVNAKLANVICYIFGLDLDIDGATEIFNKEYGNLSEAKVDSTGVETNLALYTKCREWLDLKRSIKTLEDSFKDSQEIFKNIENGRVLSWNSHKIAILRGIQHVGLVLDVQKFNAGPEAKDYMKMTESNPVIKVEDGVKDARHTTPSTNPDDYSEEQLYNYAENYYVSQDLIKKKKDQQGHIGTEILQSKPQGVYQVDDGKGNKLTLTISMSKSNPIVDRDKVKANEALFKKYSKKGTDMQLVTVRQIV